MSYEKVRSISLKDNKVFVTSASNNVRPLTYDRNFYPSLSKIYAEKGKDYVEVEILRIFEEGSFQGGTNKFTKALKVLRYVFTEEYKRFDWNNHNAPLGSKERNKEDELRKSQEFRDLFRKALDYKHTKTKFVITKDNYGQKVYGKKNPTCISWGLSPEKATKFDFFGEAKENIYLAYKDVWQVEELNRGSN